MPTIRSIIETSFTAAVLALRKDKPWVDDELNRLTDDGTIEFVDFSPVIEGKGGGPVTMQWLYVPCTWTAGDDTRNPSLQQKLDLTRALITNAICSIEDLLLHTISQGLQLGTYAVVAGYTPWRSKVYYLRNIHAYVFTLALPYAQTS